MLKRTRFFTLIGILLAAVCGVVGLAACGEHVHEWGEWETVTAATCTAEGSEKRVCKECDEEETRALPTVEHTYSEEWETVTAATCIAEGQERNTCEVCGNEQTRTVAKISHTAAEVEKVDATCIAEGHEAGTECSVCGIVLSGLQKIDPLGHSYGDTVHKQTASCTQQGLDQRICERCGDVQDTILDFLPHTPVPIAPKVEPDCTTPGMTAGQKCDVCDYIIEARQPIDPLGHEMQNPVHYEKDGVNYHKGSCSRCDVSNVDEPCDFTVVKTAATCTAAEHHVHTCPTCQFKYEHDEGDPLGHNFGDWYFDVQTYDKSLRDADGSKTVVRQHIRVCSNPGHTPDPDFPEAEACGKEQVGEPVAATCIMSGYTNYQCTTCHNEYTGDRVDAFGHDYKRDEGGKLVLTYEKYHGMDTHYKECLTCGQKSYYACRYETSQFFAADCEHGKRRVYTCADCKSENTVETGEALGHVYGAWTHDDTTSGSTSKHYRICGRAGCEHREEADCEMKPSNQVPTCEAPGQIIDVCKDCKYTVAGGEIAMLEHDFTGQPYGRDHANRQHYQTCKRCNTKVYEKCPYELTTTSKTCTTDESTRYYCPICKDDFTEIAQKTAGHVVTEFNESNKFYHTGSCNVCHELVSVPHDFSVSNICKVCRTDGLSYAFEAGSENTRARVVRGIKDGVVYNIDAAKIVIPEEVDIDGRGAVPVVGISTDAFFGNRNIVEVELPLSLTYIGYNAFYGCTNLANVYFTGHTAGEHNVSNCQLNRIEGGAFYGCTALTNAILPNTLQYIGAQAFRGCTSLDEIEIPTLVTEIEDHAFMDTAYFNDPENWAGDVLYIGPHLIRARTTLAGENGAYRVNENVVSISAEAFMDCKLLTKIELPATLKAIDRDAFKGCDALTTVVFDGTFEEYVGIRFDNDAASPMHFATTLTIAGAVGTPEIPEGATVIPAGAFRGSAVEHIVIPASVTTIGANAFRDCANLESITFEAGSKLLSVGANVVTGSKFYSTAANWTDGVLYLKDTAGTPVALVAVDKERVTATFEESYKKVEIAQGTRVVAPRAFENFETLRYVVVPDTVIFLGEGVFSGCTGPDRVNFRGTGLAWFCYSPQLGRVYTDASVYGGSAENEDVTTQRKAADMFATYTLQWKRGNYGSGN